MLALLVEVRSGGGLRFLRISETGEKVGESLEDEGEYRQPVAAILFSHDFNFMCKNVRM